MTQAASLPTTDAYIPGVCNINRKEIANRRMIGYISLAVLVVLLVILVAAGLNRYLRLILAVPAIVMISGFLQARNHFCVGYAGAGQHNANEGGSATDITDESAKKADKKRASTMNRQSFAGGVVIALLTLLIPVFHS